MSPAVRFTCCSSSPTFDCELLFALAQLLDLLLPRFTARLEAADGIGDLLLLARDLLGLLQRVADVALGAAGLRLLEACSASCSRSSAAEACAAADGSPLAEAWRIASAASRSCRAVCASSGRFSSRDSCSSRRAASSTCSASARC